jgi:Uncharacterized protein conserved in bacteria
MEIDIVIIEKSIDKMRKYIIENTVLIEDDRKEVENSKKIKYDKKIVLDINNIMSYKDPSKKYGYRFLIEYDLKNGNKNKKALFIMKNPSMADENWSDNTVNRVLETMHNFQYSKVYIMNLIPEYAPKPCDIHVEYLYKDLLDSNDELIEILSDNVSRVFVAWGGNKSHEIPCDFYKLRIDSVKIELQGAIKKNKVYCYCYNKDETPRHPGRARWWNTKRKECEYKLYQ